MIIYVGKDYQDVSRKAANIMSAQIIMKPNAVLGLATGSTPVGLYKQLIEWYNKGDLDFSQITSVNLDEYKGLSGDNDQSYRYFMNTNLFDHVNIDKNKTYVPNGLEEDSDKACADYNEIIRSVGGIDIQLLGIGGNGHIGFNEPGVAAGDAALLRACLADLLEEGADLFGLHECVALGVGEAEPTALGGIAHRYKAPFVVIVVSGVRVGHRGCCRGRGLLGFQPGNFRAAGVDLALDTGNLGGVRAALLLKGIHSRGYSVALLVGARLSDLAERLAKLLFSRGKAVSRLLQRSQLRTKRGDLAVQD